MSKFAALVILGATCAQAHWADMLDTSDSDHAPYNVDHHYSVYDSYREHSLPLSEEGRHLANLVGLQENGLHPEVSNSLDEVAAAMLSDNIDYAESHLHDEMDQEIPTFHVVHSESDEELVEEGVMNLRQSEKN